MKFPKFKRLECCDLMLVGRALLKRLQYGGGLISLPLKYHTLLTDRYTKFCQTFLKHMECYSPYKNYRNYSVDLCWHNIRSQTMNQVKVDVGIILC